MSGREPDVEDVPARERPDSEAATPYPELNAVLEELAAGIRGALGDNLVGVYLQGSFAIGGFDRHSDVDFLVVAAEELTDGQVQSLRTMHGRVYDGPSEWAKHLEGSYFPVATLADLEARSRPLWYLDHGARDLIRSQHCNTLVVRCTLREHGVVLDGPEPATLIEVVPVELLREEISRTMVEWGNEILTEPKRFSNRFYQGFIVLNYCRMLRDLEAGRVGSKPAGARWAKERLDRSWSDLIDRAWDCRPDPAVSVREPADSADFARTLEFVQYANGIRGMILSRLREDRDATRGQTSGREGLD